MRLHVEAATPEQHLLVTILLCGLLLVQALQGAIVLLIEAPCLNHGNPILVHCVKHVVQGLYGTLQVRSVGNLEMEAFLLHQLTCVEGFLLALLGEVNIGPTCETVLKIPLALAVAD